MEGGKVEGQEERNEKEGGESGGMDAGGVSSIAAAGRLENLKFFIDCHR